MDLKEVLRAPLPKLLALLGVLVCALAAAAGEVHWGNLVLPRIDTSGRIGLGVLGVALCGASVYLWRHTVASDKRSLEISFSEILGPGADHAKYEFRDLTTVDAFIDDIYRTRLQGAVSCHSYSTEWILATKGGEKLYDIGSQWAEGQGVKVKPGHRVPEDDRLVTNLAWFRQGGSFRVQRLGESSINVPFTPHHPESASPNNKASESFEEAGVRRPTESPVVVPSDLVAGDTAKDVMALTLVMRETGLRISVETPSNIEIRRIAQFLAATLFPHLMNRGYEWTIKHNGNELPRHHTLSTCEVRTGDVIYLVGRHREPIVRPFEG